MQQVSGSNVISIGERSPREWAKLIRKLRWIGLDEEARRLEMAVSTLPQESKCIVSAEPFSTD
jgi:hypothetical protein